MRQHGLARQEPLAQRLSCSSPARSIVLIVPNPVAWVTSDSVMHNILQFAKSANPEFSFQPRSGSTLAGILR